MSASLGAAPEAAARIRPGLVLAVCCTSLFLVTVDGSIVHVALPDVRRDLGGGIAGLQWVVDGYLMVMASLLVLAGSAADRLGRRRVFVTGLVVFGAGSLLCGLATSVPVLVAARVVQGVGAAMLNPVALSIIVGVYPDVRRRARAIGAWSAVSGLGVAAGPPLGGLVVELGGWRWVFLLTVPFAVLAVGLTLRCVPESRSASPRRSDAVGQVLLTAVVAGLVVTLIEGPHRGWGPPVVAVLAGTLLALGLAVRHGLRHPAPLIDPRLFRARGLPVAVGCAIGGFACFGGTLFALSLTLQGGSGLDALTAGLLVLPLGLAALATAPVAGLLVGRGYAAHCLLTAGLLLTAASLGLAVVLGDGSPRPSTPLLVALLAAFGVGFGLLNPPVTAIAIAGLPRERSGVAGAIASTSRQLGLALGVAVAGSLVGAVGGVVGGLVWVGLAAGGLVVAVLAVVALAVGVRRPEGPARSPGRRGSGSEDAEPVAVRHTATPR